MSEFGPRGEAVFRGHDRNGKPIWVEVPPGAGVPESYYPQAHEVQKSPEERNKEWLDAWNRDLGIEVWNDGKTIVIRET